MCNITKLLMISILFFSCELFAHQPKLVNYSPSKNSPYFITRPEISKVYFGQLTGEPHYYKITSDREFKFYAGILIPKVNNSYNWVSIETVDEDGNLVFSGDGKHFDWKAWEGPRNSYWAGPNSDTNQDEESKIDTKLGPGNYLIKVFNDDNSGSYALSIGKAEYWGETFWEEVLIRAPITFYVRPYMDIIHWKKFDIRTFIPHISVLVLLTILFLLIRKVLLKNTE